MICEECNSREATCTIKVITGGESRLKHVCNECMQKFNRAFTSGNIQDLLSSIFSAIIPELDTKSETENETIPEIVCNNCGMTYRQFKEKGRLGCPECYAAFRHELEPMLQQIHGRLYHAGRQVLTSERAQRQRSRQEELTRQMNQAVAMEDFETAARLRDMLKEIAAEEAKECLRQQQ